MQLSLENHKANVFEKFPFDESKQSVMFIPGAGMDHRILSMFDLTNLKDNFNILGLDLPGHGYTSGPIVNSIQEHSEFCLKIFESLSIERPILIGHSWGGLVALDLSTRIDHKSTICMNIAYPFMVGDMLLDYAKGNLDQAVDFLMKYGIYKMPKTEIKLGVLELWVLVFMEDQKDKLNRPMVLKWLRMIQKEKLSYIL